MRFLGRKGWVTEAKINMKIFKNNRWVKLKDCADSLNIRDMIVYSIDEETYFMKSIITRMKNIGKVQVIISKGINSERFFATNRIDWKSKKVIDRYLRGWDIEVFHRELRQDGLEHLYQRTHEGLLGTAKLSLLGELLLEITAIRSMDSQLKTGRGTPGMSFRSMAMRILVDLLKAMEKGGKEFLNAVLETIGKPYRSTMDSKKVKSQKYSIIDANFYTELL